MKRTAVIIRTSEDGKRCIAVDCLNIKVILDYVRQDERHQKKFRHICDIILKGSRSLDNCYTLTQKFTCHASSSSFNITDLWHEKLGHINFKNLKLVGVDVSASHI